MPQIGPMEIMVVSVIALIAFGPQRLPEIARTVARFVNEARRQAADVRAEFEAGIQLDDDEAQAPLIHKPTTDSPEPSIAGPDDEPGA